MNKPLSNREIEELQEYEQMAGKSNGQSKVKAEVRRRRSLSQAAAKRLGFECRCIAEADKVSGLESELPKFFERHPKIRAAFDRGRLLRYLVELAPNTDMHSAARKLKQLGFEQFESGQTLRDFLDGDSEAFDLWETARVNGEIANWKSLRDTAKDGNVPAIKLLDKWTVDRQREKGETASSANFFHISVSQMAELFGTTRQTIHTWYTEKGLPQNADGSFDLFRAIGWYGDFCLKKTVRGRDAISPLNPFQAVKTERERLKLEQDRGELIENGAVIGYEIAMMQNVVNGFNSISDLANRVFGQPREEIVSRLEDFRDDVMAKLQHVPAELKLSDEAMEKLKEFQESIQPQKHKKDSATEGTETTEKGK